MAKREKKSKLVEDAILEMKRIQETMEANTKEILRSVAKEEIEDQLNESLNEDDYYDEEEVDVDADAEVPMGDEAEVELDSDVDTTDMGSELEEPEMEPEMD